MWAIGINPPIRGSIADLEEGKIVLHASLNPPIRGSIDKKLFTFLYEDKSQSPYKGFNRRILSFSGSSMRASLNPPIRGSIGVV